MEYLVVVTYSFDSDYMAYPCKTETEAINKMEELLMQEVKTTIKEGESVEIIAHTNIDVELVSDIDDKMFYRVFEVGHGVK